MADSHLPAGLADLIARRLGLSVQGPSRNALTRLLTKMARADGEPDRLADLIQEESFASDAWQSVINALAIGETRFLRQRTWFAQVERLVLAPLVARKALAGRKQLRIWCAGCSSGEEPYTIAMLLRELCADRENWDIDILATDVRRDAIAAAEAGEYGTYQLRELGDDRSARFFRPAGRSRHAIAPVLRDLVRFELGNLAELESGNRHYDGAAYDLIVCRNVLMYMVPDAQRRIARRLCGALSEEGWIAASPAESIADWFRPLAAVNAGDAILFTKKAPAAGRPPATPRLAQPVDPAPRPVKVAGRRDRPAQIPATHPAAPKSDLPRVQRLADAGRLQEAEALCRHALELDGLNGEGWILLTAILVERGDFTGAFESARRAVYLMPSSAPALNLLAGTLLKLGHTERARRTFAAAERLAEGAAVSASEQDIAATGEPLRQEVGHADGV
jgi:chemotaxis protein methyltransferase CheR